MKKIYTLLSLLLISLTITASEDKILLIAADDLSRDWISAYGSVNKTPIIDKLAENGLRFNTSWQSAADKTKAEKNFFTGSYKGTGSPFPLSLKKAGYQTYYLGSAGKETLLKNKDYIQKSGFDYFSINSGKVQNLELKNGLAKSVILNMNKTGKVFTMVRFSSENLKTKSDYKKYISTIESFLKGMSPLLQNSSKCTVIFTSISGSRIHEKMNIKLDKKTTRNPFGDKKKYKDEKLAVKDADISLPLIVKSPLIPEKGLYTRDLTDGTDIAHTILDLAGVKPDFKKNSKSLKPAISGNLNPLIKRNWIFCDAGSDRLIRSWHYIYYTSDKIFGINADPEQKMNLLVGKNNDKHYAGERVRLKMIYEREFLGKKPKMDQLIKIETLEK